MRVQLGEIPGEGHGGRVPDFVIRDSSKEETTVVAKRLLHTLRTVTVHSHRPTDERPCASRRGRP